MEIAIAKAESVGMGMVTMSNGRHLGMAAYHAMMALDHDMIGMCMTSAPPIMLPTFGAEPRLGTNPIAVAAPAANEAPFVFDAATTAVAGNKLILAKRLGNDILPGWLAEQDGSPIMEEFPPPDLTSATANPTFLLPVGATRELGSHKGYGWACIVEILGGILSGGGYGMNPGRPNFGHSVAAYRIDAFMDVADFQADDGRVAGEPEDDEARPGPRPGLLSRPAGGGRRGRPQGERHTAAPGGRGLVPRHVRRAGDPIQARVRATCRPGTGAAGHAFDCRSDGPAHCQGASATAATPRTMRHDPRMRPRPNGSFSTRLPSRTAITIPISLAGHT